MAQLPTSHPRDPDGYAAIGDYAVLGNGQGIALIATDGSVDWWAVPRLDSPPPLAAILDPERGGRFTLQPVDPSARAARRYVPHTNVLETTWTTDTGAARVTDSLNSGNAGALPWSELGRRVEGLTGTVDFSFALEAGDGLRRWEPWVEDDERGPIVHAGAITMGLRHSPEITVRHDFARVYGTFGVGEGDRRVLGVVAADNDPLFLCDVDSIDHRIDVTTSSWREWSTQVDWTGEGREAVVRSALALKTLVVARTGAVAAAATTSLPESVGGPKNWDYRFAWIRDAALTIDALALLGLEEEVHAAVSWLLHAIRDNGPDVHVMYTLDGDVPTTLSTADVPGYRLSRPVQTGNQAAGQVQLGVYGDLFSTVAGWVFGGHVLDTRSARELADLADRCADVWRHDDAGIWELTTNRQYTSSKMNCWRALSAAAGMAEQGHLPGTGGRWRSEAARIKDWVDEHCWSSSRDAYTFYAGTDELDASVLLGAVIGFERGPRMSSTIDALGAELGAGPLLYRYSGVHREEGTFTACAYWRVTALTAVGRRDEAAALLRQLTATDNDLGLMSEMVAADTDELLGNLPQALSHLTFIQAVHALRDGLPAADSKKPRSRR